VGWLASLGRPSKGFGFGFFRSEKRNDFVYFM
jgi:hypothetical protein